MQKLLRRAAVIGALMCALLFAGVGMSTAASASPGQTGTSAAPVPDVAPPAGSPQKPPPSSDSLLTSNAPSAADSVLTEGCDAGWVCLYEGDIWDGSPNHPMVYAWYYYGTYNLSGIYGDHTLMNCQTGTARVALWSGYGGTGTLLSDFGNNCAGGLWADFTPVNSVQLY